MCPLSNVSSSPWTLFSADTFHSSLVFELSALSLHINNFSAHLGNGYSPRYGEGDIGERLSTDSRGVGEAMMINMNLGSSV
jgi:hypothetical protein